MSRNTPVSRNKAGSAAIAASILRRIRRGERRLGRFGALRHVDGDEKAAIKTCYGSDRS